MKLRREHEPGNRERARTIRTEGNRAERKREREREWEGMKRREREKTGRNAADARSIRFSPRKFVPAQVRFPSVASFRTYTHTHAYTQTRRIFSSPVEMQRAAFDRSSKDFFLTRTRARGDA